MPNYSNGKIYKIICNKTGKQYIGSTCVPLSSRLAQHKSEYKRYLKGLNRFTTSFHAIKENDCKIVLIENVNCNNKEELLRRERYHIEILDCVNKIIPTRTIKEYKTANKEKQYNYQIEFRKKNKDKLYQYYLKYKDKNSEIYNCVCGSKVSKKHKSGHFKTKKHILYINSLKNDAPVELPLYLCDCGSKISKCYKSEHFKTKKHIRFIESKNC